MDISFQNKDLEDICLCESALQEHFGEKCGYIIALNINVLMHYDHLDDVPAEPPDSLQILSDGDKPSFSVGAENEAKIYFRPSSLCGETKKSDGQSLKHITGIEIFDIQRGV